MILIFLITSDELKSMKKCCGKIRSLLYKPATTYAVFSLLWSQLIMSKLNLYSSRILAMHFNSRYKIAKALFYQHLLWISSNIHIKESQGFWQTLYRLPKDFIIFVEWTELISFLSITILGNTGNTRYNYLHVASPFK